jgi:hypothetical protein
MPLPPIRPPGIAERSQLAALAGNAASLPAPAPEPKAQPSALPVPPQRALVAAVPEPRPEPDQAPQRVAGLPIPPARPRAVEPAAPIEPAPTVVAGMPEPPRRASFTVASVTPQSVPAQPPQKNVLADAKPLLAAKPELTPESTAQGFAAAPPPRPARPAPAIRPIATRKTVDPEARASLRSATRGRLAAPDRPDYVITVEQPKVAEEVRRGVVAMKLGQAPQIPANGGFSGRFIQPLGASFTRTGE